MPKKKSQRSKLIQRLLLALKSRQMIIALSTVVGGLLMLAVPELKFIREELLTLFITLALAAIGSYTLQETTSSERQRQLPRGELRELLEDVLNDIADEEASSEGKSQEATQIQYEE